MGKLDSSRCVVKPVFDELMKSGKITDFIKMVLPQRQAIGDVVEIRYSGHGGEKVIQPKPEFLDWCRHHPEALCNPDKARECLKENPSYRFEGGTHPDVYIKTTLLTVVIEAKWTEHRITSHTTWRKEGERDQLIRHMDALLPFEPSQKEGEVYGLFLIDECGKISQDVLRKLFASEWYFIKSLPHRVDNGSFRDIMSGFCGVYTWQSLRKTLGLVNPRCIN
jgi:hypothetical protein